MSGDDPSTPRGSLGQWEHWALVNTQGWTGRQRGDFVQSTFSRPLSRPHIDSRSFLVVVVVVVVVIEVGLVDVDAWRVGVFGEVGCEKGGVGGTGCLR